MCTVSKVRWQYSKVVRIDRQTTYSTANIHAPALSYRRYVFCTPPNDQPARRCTAVDDGHAVDPEAQNVAAPLRNE